MGEKVRRERRESVPFSVCADTDPQTLVRECRFPAFGVALHTHTQARIGASRSALVGKCVLLCVCATCSNGTVVYN